MHMADALVTPAVAGVAAVISVAMLAVAGTKVKREDNRSIVPLMGVMGAFVFAAQMINFSIPGTGSSGHIIGGVLLATMLGPWAALLTLASVLVIQCLVFADGGLMALGCNILNMGICTTLIAYPLIYRPLVGHGAKSFWRIMGASVVACIVGLEIGACFVTAETELSGITALTWGQFFGLMTGIHFFIGLGEGIATGLVVWYVRQYNPSLLLSCRETAETEKSRKIRFSKKVLIPLVAVTLIFAGTFTWLASSNPDGLEWSIAQMTGNTDLPFTSFATVHDAFSNAQSSLSFMPDYESTWSGIVGCSIVVLLVWAVSSLLTRRQPVAVKHNADNTTH